jgi:hypothetical protein
MNIMPFNKPCRIHNTSPTGIPAGFSVPDRGIHSTLTEYKDHYELRIRIPRHILCDYDVFIKDGMLVINGIIPLEESDKSLLLACFLVPANAKQQDITGVYRNYGLKIIMPIIPDGKIIKVPLVRESKRPGSRKQIK